MRIDVYLNQDSVSKAIEQLEDYRDSLAIKNEDFVYELLRLGITVAEEKVVRFNPETNEKEGYGKYISFSKKGKGGIKTIGYLVGKDTQKIVAEWQYYDEKKTAVLSPILLAEFGSATYAEVLFDVAVRERSPDRHMLLKILGGIRNGTKTAKENGREHMVLLLLIRCILL